MWKKKPHTNAKNGITQELENFNISKWETGLCVVEVHYRYWK